MINIGNNLFLAPSQIQALLDYTADQITSIVEKARQQNRVYDCTPKGNARTAIVTDNGYIFLSEMTTRTIRSKINKENVA